MQGFVSPVVSGTRWAHQGYGSSEGLAGNLVRVPVVCGTGWTTEVKCRKERTYTTEDTTAPLVDDWLIFRACSRTLDFASSIDGPAAVADVDLLRAKHA